MSYVESVGIPGLFGLTGAKTAYKDEGILLGEAQAINFVGTGVAATLNEGVLTVEVEGGSGSINVVDNLLSTSATDALSANQGKALDGRLQTVENEQATYGDIVTYNASYFVSNGSLATQLGTKADLVGGFVPASQLPSFVDDILEYPDLASFPVSGEAGKLYVALDTNLVYRWTGSTYAMTSASLALGSTATTAYRGDHGAAAYAHSQEIGNPHGVTKSDIGLGNVDNTSDADKPISTATQTALNGKQDSLPAPTGSTKFLREDSTWQDVPVPLFVSFVSNNNNSHNGLYGGILGGRNNAITPEFSSIVLASDVENTVNLWRGALVLCGTDTSLKAGRSLRIMTNLVQTSIAGTKTPANSSYNGLTYSVNTVPKAVMTTPSFGTNNSRQTFRSVAVHEVTLIARDWEASSAFRTTFVAVIKKRLIVVYDGSNTSIVQNIDLGSNYQVGNTTDVTFIIDTFTAGSSNPLLRILAEQISESAENTGSIWDIHVDSIYTLY